MASYKVLQDIEAEDTLIGPLTLRQCIYAAIAAVSGYLCYLVISKGAPYLVVLFLPTLAGGAFFAFPWSKQQTTEVWALAKIRFFLKPRKRIWNQSGVKQLVTITAPKSTQKLNTHNLTPNEVQSRLRALADTIDSRGWAVKNIGLGYYTQPSLRDSDRLLDPSAGPQEVPELDPDAASDIFDTANNDIAHKFDTMIAQSAGAHHQQLVNQMQHPGTTKPAALTKYWHMKTIQPIGDSAVDYGAIRTPGGQDGPAAQAPMQAADDAQAATPKRSQAGKGAATGTQQVTDQPDPAILELANNNDLNVATLAREAKRKSGDSDEVVISLH
jgi:hypothetical protein